MHTQDTTKNQNEVFYPGNLLSSLGTKSGENREELSGPSQSKFKILVVDDNENIRDMLEDFLNFEGHTPVLAKDGEEALKIFSEQDFNLIITDLGMPGMSGWELTRHIKQRKPEIPVVVITGWGAQLNSEDLKENKVELILSKPFHLDQVKQVIEKVGAKLFKQHETNT
jgi:CheY-like chemotaxis protein